MAAEVICRGLSCGKNSLGAPVNLPFEPMVRGFMHEPETLYHGAQSDTRGHNSVAFEPLAERDHTWWHLERGPRHAFKDLHMHSLFIGKICT